MPPTTESAQAQKSRALQKQDAITLEQSVLVVSTFLKASIGAIAFLRGLLPEENFDKAWLVPKDCIGSVSSQASQVSQGSQSSTSKFHFKVINSNTSNEGQQLTGLLDSVIDAVQRGYLRKCIFGIYLSEDDPNNMLETYTFDFTYEDIGNGDLAPTATLSTSFNHMKLDQRSVPSAAGFTLKGVKDTLKATIRQICTLVGLLEALPKHRRATFKLYYYDDRVPEDWEPKYFSRVDDQDHAWFFKTHDRSEQPKPLRVPSFRTGFHGVDLCITSIADYLPKEDDETVTLGMMTTGRVPIAMNPVEQAQRDAHMTRIVEEDTAHRMVRWDEEGLTDLDADGEEDEQFKKWDGPAPLLRKPTPDTVQELNIRQKLPDITTATETQDLGDTVALDQSLSAVLAHGYKTAGYNSRRFLERPRDVEELPSSLERRPSSVPVATDDSSMDVDNHYLLDGERSHTMCTSGYEHSSEPAGDAMDCPCGVKESFPNAVRCDYCQKWYHISCVGYNGLQDNRLPSGKFECFECDLHGNSKYAALKINGAASAMVRTYVVLAQMRRAIKVVETTKVNNAEAFRQASGFDLDQALTIWNRLDNEGFIEAMHLDKDKAGIMVKERPVKVNGKKTKVNPRNIKWRFVNSALKSAQYRDYFDPQSETVWRLLGVSDSNRRLLAAGAKDARARRAFADVRNTAIASSSTMQTDAFRSDSTAGPETDAPRTRRRAAAGQRPALATMQNVAIPSSRAEGMPAVNSGLMAVAEAPRTRKRTAATSEYSSSKKARVSRGGQVDVTA